MDIPLYKKWEQESGIKPPSEEVSDIQMQEVLQRVEQDFGVKHSLTKEHHPELGLIYKILPIE